MPVCSAWGFPLVESVDQEVEQTPRAQRSVDEVRQQSPVGIAFGAARREDGVQQRLGKGLLLVDAVQDIDGEFPWIVTQGAARHRRPFFFAFFIPVCCPA